MKNTKKADVPIQMIPGQSIEQNEERIAIALDATGNGFFDFDLDTRQLYISPRLYSMTGYTPEELPSTFDAFISLVHPENKNPIFEKIRELMENRINSYKLTIRIKSKDGKWLWILSRGKIAGMNSKGKPSRVVGAFVDITDFKEAETKSREKEERLNLYSTAVNEAVYDWDLISNTMWQNEACQSIFGYSIQEVTPDWWFEKVHPDDRERVKNSIKEKLVKGDRNWSCEFRFRRSDGNYILIFDRCFLAYNSTGKPVRIIGAAMDITQAKQAEEALKRSEATLRSILAAAPIDIALMNSERQFIWFNEKKISITNQTMSEINFNPKKVYTSEEEYKRVGEVVYSKVWKGEVGETDTKWVNKEGKVLDIHVSAAALDPNDKSAGVVFITQDITGRKQVEEALKRSEVTMRSIFAATPIGISLLTQDRKILWVNDWMANMMGYTKEEMGGRDVKDVYGNEEEYIRVGKVIYKDVWQGKIGETDTKWIHKDGRVMDIHVSVVAVDYKDKSAGVVFTAQDITPRKQMEEAVKRSEATMRSIFMATPIGISLITQNRKIAWVNDWMMFMGGYTLEELEYNSKNIYLCEEEFKRVGDVVYSKVWNGEVGETDTKWIHKDGRILDVHVSAVAVDYKDKSSGVVFTAQDITQRKQIEENLRASEERFKKLIESVTDYIYTVKVENGVPVSTTHGPGCITVTGYTSREFELDSMLWYRMIHDEDRQRVIDQSAKVLSGEEVKPIEHRIIHKSGTVRWVRNTPVRRFEGGRLVAYDGLISDITEHMRMEDALSISEEKYRDIFNRSIEGIFQSTYDGKFISVNPSFYTMLGYRSAEELISSVTDIKNQLFVNPEDRVNFIKELEKNGSMIGYEHQFYRKDGTKIWISTNARIVRDPRRKILYLEGSSLDITKHKQAELEKEKLQTDLRQAQKMEAIGTFVGGIAHDFNNMLSVMLGYGSLLQSGLKSENPMRKYVDLIVESAEKAASLTQGLLSFSRKRPINLKNIKLNDVIRNTEKLLKTLLTEDIIINVNLTEENTTLLGDPSQIDQILFNLGTNSRDAMPKGGTITIETRVVNLDKIIVGYEKPGRYVLLSFSDTGIGMDLKTREHIFDPFFTTKEVGKGTGLGLSTVYGIIKQHNGYITVYSEPKVGTSFHVYFPLSSTSAEVEKPSLQKFRKGRETILIAEDNENVRKLMKTILTAYGYTIIEAVDGEDAIEKSKRIKNIDLMIVDTIMPKKNGREVYDEIFKFRPDVKTIFTSGYTRDVVLDKGIKDKEFNFLPKPITPGDLLQKVGQILDGK
jgi:two-component system, cell cycle sensor histidine kinase and response regulator CckA